MELPEVGKQCSKEECKRLDFLPFVCNHCQLTFCQDHFAEHICQNISKDTNTKAATGEELQVCEQPGCEERSYLPFACDKCNKKFCLTHRHVTNCGEADRDLQEQRRQEAVEKAQANNLLFQGAKTVVDHQVDVKIENAKRKSKNISTANKVQLMRLKLKATGQKGIPTDDRVYFLVHHSKICPEGRPVFVSSHWSIGRVIDAVASECKIQNNNNVATAPKLRLFKRSDNNVVSEDLSVILNQLLEQQFIINGDSLNIETV